jgi:hypothetical protein
MTLPIPRSKIAMPGSKDCISRSNNILQPLSSKDHFTLQEEQAMKKDTQCVHSGTHVDSETKGLNTPIYTSSSLPGLFISKPHPTRCW